LLHVILTTASLEAEKGGVSRTLVELARGLGLAEDIRVTLISADRAGQADIIRYRGSQLPGRTRILDAGGLLPRVWTEARAVRATSTIVHDNGLWHPANLKATAAAHQLCIPLLISPHGMLEPWALAYRGLRKRIALATYQGWALRSARVLLATSHQEADGIRRAGLRQPIAVVSNGIQSPPQPFLRRAAGVRTALFLSRLHPKKGVTELIQAWGRVRPHGWRLRIVGPDDGGYREVLRRAIDSLGLAQNVDLLGGADESEKWQHYAEAELFVLPTYSENFGLVVGEALACGVPVITTTETPWQEVRDRECGWIIPPNLDALEGALRAATALPAGLLNTMGERGRAWVPVTFSWTAVAGRVAGIYRWVAAGCAPGLRPECVTVD